MTGTPQGAAERKATLYVDPVSPFAYFYLEQLHRLPGDLDLEIVPVLFGVILSHHGQLGPAEIGSKRLHTYRNCVWVGRQLGVDFAMPPRHPFSPLKALRLLASLGNPPEAIRTTSAFVFREGRDPENDFEGLCSRLGVSDGEARIADPAVKLALRQQTDRALAEGVFGVPTLVCRGELFWGVDTIDWFNAFWRDPAMFRRSDMAAIDAIAEGVKRRQAG
jgi:2-hydroxychromene-2-carboxylate isomerase